MRRPRIAGLGLVLTCIGVLLSSCQRQVEPAETMRITMYDDGLACPGNCDAHVVFAPRHNGTRNAFQPPLERRSAPEDCTVHHTCMICLDETDESCFPAVYRGGGPPAGTFDFTPAFFAGRCDLSNLQARLAATCRDLYAAVMRLGFDRRTNCFNSPSDGDCAAILAEAARLKALDDPERLACLVEGEGAYNARQTDRTMQRSLGCNYERFGTEPGAGRSDSCSRSSARPWTSRPRDTA